jgi:hypothetical protein
LLLLIVFGVIWWFLLPLVTQLATLGWKRGIRREPVGFREHMKGTLNLGAREVMRAFVFDILFLSVVFLPVSFSLVTAGEAADGQASGQSVLSIPWRAEAALVHTLGDELAGLQEGTCVLYLGSADGLFALYDPLTQSSWRVPTTAVALETGGPLSDVQHVPQDCPSSSR